MSPKTSVAYQRDLESFGSYLEAVRTGAEDLDAHRAPPYLSLETAAMRDVIEYMQRLNQSRAYAPRSLKRKLSALRSFYKFLRFDGRRHDNPTADVPGPKLGTSLPKALTMTDARRLLSTEIAGLTEAQRARDRAIIECLYSSGLRRSELLALNVADVDFAERSLRVVRGKGGKERFVPVTHAAVDAMTKYLQVRARAKDDAFFLGRGGERLSGSGLYKIVRTYMIIAGLEGRASPHTMRHTLATHLYENGADLMVIKEIMGHESLATTQIYTKVARRRVLEQFDAAHPRDRDADSE